MATLQEYLVGLNARMEHLEGAIRTGALGALGDARSALTRFYDEARALIDAFDKGLNPPRAAFITLEVEFSSSVNTGGSGTDEYRVEDNEDFVVEAVAGHFSAKDWDGETLAIAGIGNPGVQERIAMKASNCRINLKRRSDSVPYTIHQDLALSDILAAAGGEPLSFGGEDAKWVIPHSQTIVLTATLRDTAAALVGGSALYGVTLVGTFIKRE